MTSPAAWRSAPCGLLLLGEDAVVAEANGTVLRWTERPVEEVVGAVRLPDLLSVAGRIYWETHLAPLLRVQGGFEEVALDLRTPAGLMPVLVSATCVQVDGETRVSVALTAVHERRRYERELLEARRSAERSARSLAALQAVTAALSSAVGARAVADALLAAVVAHLPLQGAAVWVADESGRPVLHGTSGTGSWSDRTVLPPHEPQRQDGVVLAPLPGSAQQRGLLGLAPSSDPGADELDLDVVTAIAAQAGIALDRAELFDRSSSVALALQRSLLAGQPPDDHRFSVATAYRPGVEALEVGGDWHDVFLVPGTSRVAVVVGDVVGRGLGAASAMGQLRSAVRAVATADTGPAGVLSRLDAYVEHVPETVMATLAYAELDLDSGVLRYACAGHPPPVLLGPAAEPALLWEGRSTPLGALGGPSARPEAQVRLAPGAGLLLYTDGLVERRERQLDDSLEVLRGGARGLLDRDLGDAVATLTRTLLEDERTRDDVCVLLLAWHGLVLERTLTADLHGLSGLRHELRAWLERHGVPDDVGDDLVLATSEAVANAAEHGLDGKPDAEVQLRVEVERDERGAQVLVRVADAGEWRPSTPDLERGRGLRIIRALIDDVRVDHERGTTVLLRQRWGRVSA